MFGSRLRELRLERQMTQEDLGSLIGVGKTTISQYESETRKPDTDTLSKLADIFEVPIDYLLGRKQITPMDLPRPFKQQPWMDKLTPQTRTRLESVGGLRDFHRQFLGGTSLNDLDQHDLEIIMQVYFRHLEASEAKRKAMRKEKPEKGQ